MIVRQGLWALVALPLLASPLDATRQINCENPGIYKLIAITSPSPVRYGMDHQRTIPGARLPVGTVLVERVRTEGFWVEVDKTPSLLTQVGPSAEAHTDSPWYFLDRNNSGGFDSDPTYCLNNWLDADAREVRGPFLVIPLKETARPFLDQFRIDIDSGRVVPRATVTAGNETLVTAAPLVLNQELAGRPAFSITIPEPPPGGAQILILEWAPDAGIAAAPSYIPNPYAAAEVQDAEQAADTNNNLGLVVGGAWGMLTPLFAALGGALAVGMAWWLMYGKWRASAREVTSHLQTSLTKIRATVPAKSPSGSIPGTSSGFADDLADQAQNLRQAVDDAMAELAQAKERRDKPWREDHIRKLMSEIWSTLNLKDGTNKPFPATRTSIDLLTDILGRLDALEHRHAQPSVLEHNLAANVGQVELRLAAFEKTITRSLESVHSAIVDLGSAPAADRPAQELPPPLNSPLATSPTPPTSAQPAATPADPVANLAQGTEARNGSFVTGGAPPRDGGSLNSPASQAELAPLVADGGLEFLTADPEPNPLFPILDALVEKAKALANAPDDAKRQFGKDAREVLENVRGRASEFSHQRDVLKACISSLAELWEPANGKKQNIFLFNELLGEWWQLVSEDDRWLEQVEYDDLRDDEREKLRRVNAARPGKWVLEPGFQWLVDKNKDTTNVNVPVKHQGRTVTLTNEVIARIRSIG